MILYNPLEKEVSIVIDGTKFKVGSKDTVNVSDKVAGRWLSVHAFLQAQAEVPVEEKVEVVEVKEIEEEPVKEEGEEKKEEKVAEVKKVKEAKKK